MEEEAHVWVIQEEAYNVSSIGTGHGFLLALQVSGQVVLKQAIRMCLRMWLTIAVGSIKPCGIIKGKQEEDKGN